MALIENPFHFQHVCVGVSHDFAGSFEQADLKFYDAIQAGFSQANTVNDPIPEAASDIVGGSIRPEEEVEEVNTVKIDALLKKLAEDEKSLSVEPLSSRPKILERLKAALLEQEKMKSEGNNMELELDPFSFREVAVQTTTRLAEESMLCVGAWASADRTDPAVNAWDGNIAAVKAWAVAVWVRFGRSARTHELLVVAFLILILSSR